MALPVAVQALDEVEEADRKHYKKVRDDLFVIDAPDAHGFSVINPEKLKNALNAEKKRVKELEELAKKLKDDDGNDLDIGALREAAKKMAELGDDADISKRVKAAVENQLAQAKQKHDGILSAKDAEIGDLVDQLQGIVGRAAIVAALQDESDNRTKPLDLEAMVALIERDYVRTERVKDGNKTRMKAYVIDPKTGERRASLKADNSGDMPITELADELRAMRKASFAAKAIKGTEGNRPQGGQQQPHGSSGNGAPAMSPEERLTRAFQNSPTLAGRR